MFLACSRLLSKFALATAAASTLTLIAVPATGHASPMKPAGPAQPRQPTPSKTPHPLTAAAAAAQARETGKAVEITSATAATRQFLANPDGTITLNLNPLPARVKHGATWVNLDATLKRNSDGTWSPKASASGLTLSGGGTVPLARMRNNGDDLAISWPTPLPTPTVAGNVATYAGVLPGVDLVITATEQGGFSHVLVVHDAAAAANPALATLRLTTNASGVALAADPTGNITAADSLGRPVFTAPAALMWDSSAPVPSAISGTGQTPFATARPSTATEPGDGASVAPVGVNVSGNTVTLTPDHGMLSATSTNWPVWIDPSWNPNSVSTGANAWTYISSAFPDEKYYNVNDYARVGYNGWETPYFHAASFFQFPIPSILWSAEIIDATLQATEVWSADNNRQWVDVNLVSPINAYTTWNNPPAKGRLIDRQNTPGNWRADHSDNPIETDWNVTGAIAEAAAARWPTDTLGLYNETDAPRGWRRFYHNPTVAIHFNLPPNTPSNYTTSPATPCNAGANPPYGLIGNTAVTFAATVSDPDGTQGQIEADFTITDKATGTTVATPALTVSNNQTASVTLPVNRFVDGHTYTWNVSAFDGRSRSPATPTCQFTVDHQQPAAPTVTSTTYPPDRAGPPARTEATFTFTPPAGSDPPVRYVYSLNAPLPTILPQGATVPVGAVGVPAQPGGAVTSVHITPRRVGSNILRVYAVDSAGNASSPTAYSFVTGGLTAPDVAGDLTGDGTPDAIAVGTAAMPGLWLYAGTDKSGKVNPASQIGAAGTGGPGSVGNGGDWTGAAVTMADFNTDGTQDVLVKLPQTDASGNVRIFFGGGDGQPIDPTQYKIPELPTVDGSTGGQVVDQIVAAPTAALDGLPFPDLYAVVGDNLYLYSPIYPDGAYDQPLLLSSGWSGRTIAGVAAGANPALFSRTRSTGELDLWVGDAVAGIPAGDTAGTNLVYATSGFNATSVLTIAGADIDVDGRPDLWTTTNTSVLNGYRNSGSSGLNAPVASPLAPTGPIYSGIFNKCLDPADALANAGHPVRVSDCNNSAAQVWSTPGDGTVRINNQCLDISYIRTDNGSQVALYACVAGAVAQQWTRTTLGALRNPNSGRCLDVYGAGNSGVNGTGVQIWDCNGSPQQAFTLNKAAGVFRSGIAGKCLDDAYGSTDNGNPIIIYDCNGGPTQTWTVPGDGTIRINGRCLDVKDAVTYSGAKIQLRECTGTPGQQWQAGPNYSLVNPNSGRCLDDPGYSTTNFTQLQLWDCAANSAQSWGLHLAVNGPIRSIIPVKCANDANNASGNTNPVQLWDCNGSAAQNWTAPGDGTIRINGKCLDVAGAATASLSKVQIYDCAGNGAQQWITGPNNSIVNPVSGRCLDDPYGAPTNGQPLWIYDCNGGSAQNWTLPY